MDIISPESRSRLMARIRSKNTRPELLVRKLVFALGYRYRLHAKDLPGCPDLVFRSRRKVILVHGCFWHGHTRCHLNRPPKSRLEYWEPKLTRNKQRDQRNKRALTKAGWKVLTVWECELNDTDRLTAILRRFL